MPCPPPPLGPDSAGLFQVFSLTWTHIWRARTEFIYLSFHTILFKQDLISLAHVSSLPAHKSLEFDTACNFLKELFKSYWFEWGKPVWRVQLPAPQGTRATEQPEHRLTPSAAALHTTCVVPHVWGKLQKLSFPLNDHAEWLKQEVPSRKALWAQLAGLSRAPSGAIWQEGGGCARPPRPPLSAPSRLTRAAEEGINPCLPQQPRAPHPRPSRGDPRLQPLLPPPSPCALPGQLQEEAGRAESPSRAGPQHRHQLRQLDHGTHGPGCQVHQVQQPRRHPSAAARDREPAERRAGCGGTVASARPSRSARGARTARGSGRGEPGPAGGTGPRPPAAKVPDTAVTGGHPSRCFWLPRWPGREPLRSRFTALVLTWLCHHTHHPQSRDGVMLCRPRALCPRGTAGQLRLWSCRLELSFLPQSGVPTAPALVVFSHSVWIAVELNSCTQGIARVW